MCKEMNAPVLPESKKVNAITMEIFNLTGNYSFALDDGFAHKIQMNQRKHVCLCHPTKPMMHFCCPGCLEGKYIPDEEDRIDSKRVLGNYDFDEQDYGKAIDQVLDLMIRNLPLTLYSYAKGHQAASNKFGIPTLFFADVESIHLWAGHIVHACEDYYYHEEYLHTVYHGSMYDSDWSPIDATHDTLASLQISRSRLHDRLMMCYLGGGVGVGYVEPRTAKMVELSREDWKAQASRGMFGVYLAGRNGSHRGEYKVMRARLIPHEPIYGEIVKWGPEWIGDDKHRD